MAGTIGDAFVRIRPDTTGFQKDVTNKVGGSFTKVAGIAAGAFAAVGVGQIFGSAITEAREAGKVFRLTGAVLKSTGGVANVTAGQVDKLASSLSAATGVEDDLIASSQNVLLTFTQVRNEAGKGNRIFDEGTKAALNLSAALGTDLQSATILVGKALNDPVKGVTSLTRAGVQFTKQQREQIKALVESGRTLEAQKIIIGELGTQFGGAAEAAADPIAQLNVAFKEILETVGVALIPVFNSLLKAVGPLIPVLGGVLTVTIKALQPSLVLFAEALASLLPSIAPLVELIGGALADVLKALIPALTPIVKIFSDEMLKVLPELTPAFVELAVAMAELLIALTPLLSPVIRLSALFVRMNADIIKTLAQGLSLVAQAIQPVTRFLGGLLTAVLDLIEPVTRAKKALDFGAVVRSVAGLPNQVIGALRDLPSRLFQRGKDVVQGFVNGIKSMSGVVIKALLNLLPKPLRKFADKLGLASPSTVFEEFGRNVVRGFAGGIEAERKRLPAVMTRLADVVSDFAPTMPTPALAGAGTAGRFGADSLSVVSKVEFQSDIEGTAKAVSRVQSGARR